MTATDDIIAETLLDLARASAAQDDVPAGKTAEPGFCLDDAARVLAPQDWRPLVARVRAVAGRLQRDGLIRATQAGRAVDALSAKGPIRLSRPLH